MVVIFYLLSFVFLGQDLHSTAASPVGEHFPKTAGFLKLKKKETKRKRYFVIECDKSIL